MDNAKVIGRVGALAVALGIGAGMAATPWVATAKPASSDTSNASVSKTAPGQNMSVATNGVVRVQKGTATAESAGQGSVAIAKGVNATAIAGTTECGDRCTVAPSHNKAMAIGTGADATISGGGSYNTAIANGTQSTANVDSGSNNTAIAKGTLAYASAGAGDNNTAIRIGDGGQAFALAGDNNTAVAVGDHSGATAAVGNNNTATTIGDNSGSIAGIGDNNTASVTGNNSTALAGGMPNQTPPPINLPNSNDTATVNGDGLDATATGADGITVTVP
jgi:hypothetical protein